MSSNLITLVLGGARSGKSELAEQMAWRLAQPVTYIATAAPRPEDPDFAERIARHRGRRPAEWQTVEAGSDLIPALTSCTGSVLVDSLGTWVASTPDFAVDAERLCKVLTARAAPSVLVSEEVGLGVHPSTAAGNAFRDVLGSLNQAVAAVAGDVLLVVAGRILHLEERS